MARIDQLLPAAHVGDATGDSARDLAAALRRAGHQADLYGLTVDAPLLGEVRPFEEFPAPREGDLTLLHFAMPSPLTAALQGCGGRRGIVYHNLTPPPLLLPWCPDIARLTALGRAELAALAGSGAVDLAIGVSEYSTRDLEATGFARTATLPLPLDLRRYDVAPDTNLAARLQSGPPFVLTVGRIAPNKGLEELLRVAAYYLRHIDPDVAFLIAGGHRGLEPYYEALLGLHADLELDDRVRFLGRVDHRDLVALYCNARAYACASLHEGFCAPLVEAMYFGIPILARAAAAIPETLAGAGVMFDEPEPAALAEMLHVLMTDAELRGQLADRGHARVRRFAPAQVTERWVSTLEGLLESSP